MNRLFLPALFCLIFMALPLQAYTTYRQTQGTLELHFGEPESPTKLHTVTEIDKPFVVKASFRNKADSPMKLDLTFRTIETIEFLDAQANAPDTFSISLDLAPKSVKTVEIKLVARPGTYSAHYPVRLDVRFEQEGKTDQAQIVLVLETKVTGTGSFKNPQAGQMIRNVKELPQNVLPERGGILLSSLDTYRGYWRHDNKEEQILPVAFTGSDASGASITRNSIRCDGVQRNSLNMHPPYKGGVGNTGVEYRVQLPDTKPLFLVFYSAVRPVTLPETASDGVTFRVLVDGTKVYEKHNALTNWVENRVSLDQFAGKEVLLRLESDPGSKRNTNCDSCYWGDVLLFAGAEPKFLSMEEKRLLFKENLEAVKTGKSRTDRTKVFALEGGLTAAVTFGKNGFVDGTIGLGNPQRQVQFDGLRVWCKGQSLGGWPCTMDAGPWNAGDKMSAIAPPRPTTKPSEKFDHLSANNKQNASWAQEIRIDGLSETLFFGLEKNGPALELSVDASRIDLIDRIELGPATCLALRVYFGHGYCISAPEAFSVSAGGHFLSTSHVGMDFNNGLSILQGSSFPPDRFVVDPATKTYTLSVHPGTKITLLPGLKGAVDCAVRYRPLFGPTAAAGVKTKSGRFVYDVWGYSYKNHIDMIRQAIRYGLTDSMFIIHSWQHYGYDNRLPDIWPPNPRLGTLEEMQEALRLCDEHGIQYGLHDNYIDFYPDADGFGFDVTTFEPNGNPLKAWNNYGIEAQSYQFRPDKVRPFLERNLDLIVPHLPMSTYFVDVFTSKPPIDFYDRHGNFHSRAESQACWNEAFDLMRERLTAASRGVAEGRFSHATTISEAGMDSLIGHLDGADCQLMYLSGEAGEFRIPIRCAEWSPVPWFDAVHHTTFSLHGVGYSSRYETGRGRLIHGIESDDYISAEILTGHALMVDSGSRDRGAVRKYRLAQDLIRHLADKEVMGVEFVDGNIFRQKITWSDGTIVLVNRGTTDWEPSVELLSSMVLARSGGNVIIPQYGFFSSAKGAGLEMGVVRIKGRVAEYSTRTSGSGKDVRYENGFVNARQKTSGAENALPVVPSLNAFEYIGNNRFRADFAWQVKGAVEKDFSIFVHCVEKRLNWHQKLKEAVLGGGEPTKPCSKWEGKVVSDRLTLSIPDELPAGRYYLVVGLYDSKGDGRRARLMGHDTGADRYAVAWIKVERKGEGDKVSSISVEPSSWNETELFDRMLPPQEMVDFGFCRTKGACYIEWDFEGKNGTVTPLPGEPKTEIQLRIPASAKAVQAVDAEGNVLDAVPFSNTRQGLGGEQPFVVFTTAPDVFCYRITW